MRAEVMRLLALGVMPEESEEDPRVWDLWQEGLAALESPAALDEAVALLDVFPEADTSAYGLAWTLLHFIETAPGWPPRGVLDDRSPWVKCLKQACINGGIPTE